MVDGHFQRISQGLGGESGGSPPRRSRRFVAGRSGPRGKVARRMACKGETFVRSPTSVSASDHGCGSASGRAREMTSKISVRNIANWWSALVAACVRGEGKSTSIVVRTCAGCPPKTTTRSAK